MDAPTDKFFLSFLLFLHKVEISLSVIDTTATLHYKRFFNHNKEVYLACFALYSVVRSDGFKIRKHYQYIYIRSHWDFKKRR